MPTPFRQILRPYSRKLRAAWRRAFVVPATRVFGPRLPVAMITGTKGKTTTTRMLAQVLARAGHRVGFASTDGVVIEGRYLNRADSAGHAGARTVLADRSITAAVLETARGDLLRSGLYIDRCSAGALLNVGREQIGIDGIDTLEQMAALKQRVIDAARDAVILNADEGLCARMIRRYPPRRVILFSLQADNPFVHAHVRSGGRAYVLAESPQGEAIERWDDRSREQVVAMAELPSAGNGLFPQNVANALAAAALAEGMAVPMAAIRAGLQSFENSLEQSPGRLNLLEGYAQTILIDHATNVPSCAALVRSLEKIRVPGRRVCMYETVGNRPGWHFAELGAILAPRFDHFVCYELEKYRRGRAPGEISGLLRDGLIAAGVGPDRIDTARGYSDATKRLSQVVGKGDLVVIVMGSLHDYLPIFREQFAVHEIGRQGVNTPRVAAPAATPVGEEAT